jgi:ribonuclease P protein component
MVSTGRRRARPAEGFGPESRLRRRPEFRRVQSLGRRVHTSHFIVIIRVHEATRRRLGVTVTKKVGSAVERNRVKRLVREVFRRNRELFPAGCDVVCIAKRGAPRLDYHQVRDQLSRARGAMHAVARKARRSQQAGEL